jgi:uncharacterized repeat protein (TIGR03803 family)
MARTDTIRSRGMVFDKSGNLHGTTLVGGTGGHGTVFEITPGGTETVLHSFAGNPDGTYPAGGVILGKKGVLYGTTIVGGSGHGTVFKVVP